MEEKFGTIPSLQQKNPLSQRLQSPTPSQTVKGKFDSGTLKFHNSISY
jgi:hypothetical protein